MSEDLETLRDELRREIQDLRDSLHSLRVLVEDGTAIPVVGDEPDA